MKRSKFNDEFVSRATSGTNAVNYATQDHLGSSSVVSDGSGAVLLKSSFGAYGARRGSNWQGSPTTGDWSAIASTSRRGFTDHTMLDNVGLIHMNGRMFDPVVGRFMSADARADGAGNSQGWNRYSYVHNNTLGATDPTGFSAMSFDELTPEQIQALSPEERAALLAQEIQAGRDDVQGAWEALKAEGVWSNMSTGHGLTVTAPMYGIDLVDRSLGISIPLIGFQTMDLSEAQGVANGLFLGQALASNLTAPSGSLNRIGDTSNSSWVQGSDGSLIQEVSNVWHYDYSTLAGRAIDAMFSPWGGWSGFSDSVNCAWTCQLPGSGGVLGQLEAMGPIGAVGGISGTIFQSPHYADRLAAAGVDLGNAETAVARAIATMRSTLSDAAPFSGRIVVDGVLIEYRAYPLPGGVVNVGTIFAVGP